MARATIMMGLLAIAHAAHDNDTPQSTTIQFGAVVHTVDARFVSYVIDPASLEINPPGVYPSYPYPVNTSSPLLRSFAAALSPVLIILQSTFLD